jgi:hypothetical protein
MMDVHDEGMGEPLDLGPLEPLPKREDLDRFVRRVVTAATPELVRRQAILTLGELLIQWRRPILAASSVLAVAAMAVLLTARSPSATSRGTLTEALGVPTTWATWVQAGEQPTPGQLLKTEESPQ